MKKAMKKCKYINAKTLKFLSLEGVYKALTGEKETLLIHASATIILLESILSNHQIV